MASTKKTSLVTRDATSPTPPDRVDNMSARSAADALEGHFVTVDRSDKDARQALEQAGLESTRSGLFVYLQPGEVNPETGVPVTAVCVPRESPVARVTLPYDALTRASVTNR